MLSGRSGRTRTSRRTFVPEAAVAAVVPPRAARFYTLGLERVYHISRSHAELESLFVALVARKGYAWVSSNVAKSIPLSPTDRKVRTTRVYFYFRSII